MTTYADFLAAKKRRDPNTGLAEIPELPEQLFPFQRDIRALGAAPRGRAAIFANTGTGKSFMELAWGRAVHQTTGFSAALFSEALALQEGCCALEANRRG